MFNKCTPQAQWGSVCFAPDGDWFYVYDTYADSAHVAVWYSVGGATGRCHNYGEAGSVEKCNYDFPESLDVTFHAEKWDDGHIVAYTGNVTASVSG